MLRLRCTTVKRKYVYKYEELKVMFVYMSKIELNSSTALSDSSKTVFKKTSIFEGLSGLFIVCTYLSSASTDHKNFSGRGEFNSILYENARKSAKLVKDFHCPKRKELIEKPGFLTLVKIFTTQLKDMKNL
jgi:hypothetical protein